VLGALATAILLFVSPAAGQQLGSAQIVQRQGAQLTAGGQPVRFLGVNLYYAAGDPDIYQCGLQPTDPDAALNDWFGRVRAETHANIVRFWAFQSYTAGATDWSGIDRVIAVASQYGLRVVPVLENQWDACTSSGYKWNDWYRGGYMQPAGGDALSYRDYVQQIVTRYRDEPTIFAWMLMNEAESQSPSRVADPQALYSFADDMTTLVRGIDPNHLLSIGVMGSGQPGVAGDAYRQLMALPNNDLVTYHDFQANDQPLPGAATPGRPDTLASARAIASQLAKPLVVDESGMAACGTDPAWQVESAASRSAKFDAKLGAFFDGGGAAYLVWEWHPTSDCQLDFTSGDPLNDVLRRYADAL
jgi:mannan endo-1,4-beta-mannosidase